MQRKMRRARKRAEAKQNRQQVKTNQSFSWRETLIRTMMPPALAASLMMSTMSGVVMAQQVVTDGKTQTQVSVTGNVTDITTSTTSGQNAYNSFSYFNVDRGNIANFYLPGNTSNLLNVVTNSVSIDGMVNSIKNGNIGGNMYFITPGFVVGESGVLNVGSLKVVTPTQDYINNFFVTPGVPSEAATAQVLNGQIPLDSHGYITVQGKINAIGNINLAGGDVANSGTMTTGAVFAAARPDMSDVVNLNGAENGAKIATVNGDIEIVAANNFENSGMIAADGASNLKAGNISVTAGNDISLNAGSLISARGYGENSAGGNIRVYATNDASFNKDSVIDVRGGEISGDGGFAEFSAARTVTLGGGVFRAGAVSGKAGTALVDPENLNITDNITPASTSSDGITWSSGDLKLEADSKINIGTGEKSVIISSRNIGSSTDYLNAVSVGNSGSITLDAPTININANSQILAHVIQQGGNDYNAGSIKLTGENITIGEGAYLLANVAQYNAGGITPQWQNAVADAGNAGNITIKAESNSNKIAYNNSKAGASVTISSKAVLSGKDIDIEALANNNYVFDGEAGGAKASNLGDMADSGWDAIKGLLGTLELEGGVTKTKATAEITVDNATIRSTGKTFINAQADSTADLRSLGLIAAVAVGYSDAEATVNLNKGTEIRAGGDVSLAATTNNTVTVTGNILKNTPIDVVVAIGKAKSTAEANIQAGAQVLSGGDVSVQAVNTKNMSVLTNVLGDKEFIGAAVGISLSDTTVKAIIDGAVEAKGDVIVDARAKTDENAVISTSKTNGSIYLDATNVPLTDKGQTAAGNVATMAGGIIAQAAGNAGGPSKIDSYIQKHQPVFTKENGLTAAVTVANHTTNVTAAITSHGTTDIGAASSPGLVTNAVKAGGGVNIASNVEEKLQTGAVANINSAQSSKDNKKNGLAAAVIVGNYDNHSYAYIGDGAVVDAKGVIGVTAKTTVPSAWNTWLSDTDTAEKVTGFINTNLGAQNFFNSWAQSSSDTTNVGLAASVDVLSVSNETKAYIGKNTRINQDSSFNNHNYQDVSVNATTEAETIDLSGNFKSLMGTNYKPQNPFGSESTTGIGGSFLGLFYKNDTGAEARDGAAINAGKLTLDAETDIKNIALAAAGGKAGSYGVDGTLTITDIDNTTLANASENADFTSIGALDIEATDNTETVNISGGVVHGESLGVGASTAINEITRDTEATIGADAKTQSANLTDLTGALGLTAKNTGAIYALSLAGALTSDTPPEPNDPLDGISLPLLFGETTDSSGKKVAITPTSGLGISGDVSYNGISDTADAYINGADVKAGSLSLTATNDSAVYAAAGAGTLAANSKGATGIAGSATANYITDNTNAYIENSSVTATNGNVDLDAETKGTVKTLAAGGSVAPKDYGLALAGSVTVNSLNNTTASYIADNSEVQAAVPTGATATATLGSVGLTAKDTMNLLSVAGGLAYGGKAGVGAAVAVNLTDNSAEAYSEASDVTAAGNVTASATMDENVVTVSASLAGASKGMAVNAAVSVDNLRNTTKAYISGKNNADQTGSGSGTTADGSIALSALNDNYVRVVAGGATLALNDKINDKNIGFGASSVSLVANNDTETYIGADTPVNVLGKLAVKVDTGAKNTKMDSNLTVDNVLPEDITASDADSLEQQSISGLSLTANTYEDLILAAAGGAGGGLDGIAAATTAGKITDTTIADIDTGAQINQAKTDQGQATDGQNPDKAAVNLVATDDTRWKDIAGGIGVGKKAGVGAAADVGLLNKDTEAYINGKTAITAGDNMVIQAASTENILSVTAGVGGGNSVGIAGSGAGYSLTDTTAAFIGKDATVLVYGSLWLDADSNTSLQMIQGAAGISGTVGVGASAGAAVVNKTTESYIGAKADDGSIDATGTSVTALGGNGLIVDDGSFNVGYTDYTDADPNPLQLGDGTDASGNETLTKKRKATKGSQTINGLAVTATNQDDLRTYTVGASVAGEAAVTLSGGVNVINNTTNAVIGANGKINQDNDSNVGLAQSVWVAAGNDLYHIGVAGAVGGAKIVGVGAGAAVAVVTDRTNALVGDGAKVKAENDVAVVATDRQEQIAVAGNAGVSGTVGVAGSVSVLSLDTATHASIGEKATIDTGDNVLVNADDTTKSALIAGSLGVGLGAVGAGGAVGVTSVTKDTQALVKQKASIDALGDSKDLQTFKITDPAMTQKITGLLVQAKSQENIFTVTAAGAGGFYAGIAGAVAVETLNVTTHAGIGDYAKINTGTAAPAGSNAGNVGTDQSVAVAAYDTTTLKTVAGSLGVGGEVAGVAGGVDVGVIKNDTGADIGAGATVNAKKDLMINALAEKDITSTAVSAAGGMGAIAGGVSVYSIGNGLDSEATDRLNTDQGGTANYINNQVKDTTVTDLLMKDQSSDQLTDITKSIADKRAALNIDSSLAQTEQSKGTNAVIGANAQITAGGSVEINANDQIDLTMNAGGAGIGAVGLGAGISVVSVSDTVNALISGTDNSTYVTAVTGGTGDVTISATLDETGTDNAYVGSGGLVALDAAVAVVNDQSKVTVAVGDHGQVKGSGAISVTTTDSRDLTAHTFGAGGGVVTAGASLASVTIGGSDQASLSNDVTISSPGKTITVEADAKNLAAASEAQAVKGGIGLAGSGAQATSSITTAVKAETGTANSLTADTVIIKAQLTPKSKAVTKGIAVGVGTVGVSISTAKIAATVAALLGSGSKVSGNSLSINATQDQTATDQVTYAKAEGSSGGLIALGFNTATAGNTTQVNAGTGSNIQVAAGDIAIAATNTSRQTAAASGAANGLIGIGTASAEASAATGTHAYLGNGAAIGVVTRKTDGAVTVGSRAGNLAVTATGNDTNLATATAGSAGIAVGYHAATAKTSGASDVSATIGGTTTLAGNSVAVNAAHDYQYWATADSTDISLLGRSGAKTENTATSDVTTRTGNNLWMDTTGKVALTAQNSWMTSADRSSDNSVTAAGGGAANGNSAGSSTNVSGTTKVNIGDAAVINTGSDGMYVVADNFLDAVDQAVLKTGGAIEYAGVASRFTADLTNAISIGSNDKFSSGGAIDIGSYTRATADSNAYVNTWGAAAVGSADADTEITSNQSVTIAGGSLIHAFGDINITAGNDPKGAWDTGLTGDATAEGYVGGIIAIPKADAATKLTSKSNLEIQSGATIESAQNVTLGAYHGSPRATADGTGHGYEVGFIPITDGNTSTAVKTTATVIQNGTVTAGMYHEMNIAINNGVVTPISGAPFLAAYSNKFDVQSYIDTHYGQGSAEAGVLSKGTSSGTVTAVTLGDLFAAGGTITINADELAKDGKGTLTSYGSPKITVANTGRDYLILGNIYIPDHQPGAKVIFTGSAGSSQYQGAIKEIGRGVDGNESSPQVTITNSYTGTVGDGRNGPAVFLAGTVQNLGGLVSVTNVKGSIGITNSIFGQMVQLTAPDGSMVYTTGAPDGYLPVATNPYSAWDSLMIWPHKPNSGDLTPDWAIAYVANAVFNADGEYTGSQDLTREIIGKSHDDDTHSVIFYGNNIPWADHGDGSDDTKGDGKAKSPSKEAYPIYDDDGGRGWFPAVPVVKELSRTIKDYPSVSQMKGISGQNVAIKARYIDINGPISAGQNATDWSLSLPAGLEYGIISYYNNKYKYPWNKPQFIDLGQFTTTINGSDTKIGAKYDVKNHRIILDDNVIAASAGASVRLEGGIISTNALGNIHVSGGLGQVAIDNRSGIPLELQSINTGNLSNLASTVEIIDTLKSSSANHWLYSYTPGQGLSVYNGAAKTAAGQLGLVQTGDSANATYNPLTGVAWQWQLQAGLGRQITWDHKDKWDVGKWYWTTGSASNPWEYVTGNGSLSTTPYGQLVYTNDANLPAFQQTITGGYDGGVTRKIIYHDNHYGFSANNYKDGGEWACLWEYEFPDHAWLAMTMTAKADNPIPISFSGNAHAKVNITSNAAVLMTGDIVNPNGDTNIAVNGAGNGISQSATATLQTKDLALTANAGVGSAAQPILVTVTNGGVMDVQAGNQGVYLDLDSGVLVDRIASGAKTGGFGEVLISADGSLVPVDSSGKVNITGSNITLTSKRGSIGSEAKPLVISANQNSLANNGTIDGVVNLSALNDIGITQVGGDLLIGQIGSTAGGNIAINVPDGNLYNAGGQTAAQALGLAEAEQVWKTLGLTEDYGAEIGKATDPSVARFVSLVNWYYNQYWKLRNLGTVNTDGALTISDSGIALLTSQVAAALNIASPTTDQVRTYVNRLFNDDAEFLKTVATGGVPNASTARDNLAATAASFDYTTYNSEFDYKDKVTSGQIKLLTQDAVWTRDQLTAALSRSALMPSSSTPVGNTTPNIIGRNITIRSGYAVGKPVSPVNVSLEDFQKGNLTQDQKAALALAKSPGDVLGVGTNAKGETVTFNFGIADGRLTIPAGIKLTGLKLSQTAPVYVDATAQIRVSASQKNTVCPVYLQGSGASQNLSIDRIWTLGDIYLTTPQNITAAVGGDGQPLSTYQLDGDNIRLISGTGNIGSPAVPFTYEAGGDLTLATAGKDIYLKSLTGNMVIGGVAAGGTAWLDSEGGDIIALYLGGTAVQGDNIYLAAAGNFGIGSVINPLTVKLTGDGTLSGSAGGDVAITTGGDILVKTITSANGNISLTASGSILNRGDSNTVNLKAVNMDLKATNGRIGEETAYLVTDATGTVNAAAKEGIYLNKRNGNLVANSLTSDNGVIGLSASNGSISVTTLRAPRLKLYLPAAGSTLTVGTAWIDDSINIAADNVKFNRLIHTGPSPLHITNVGGSKAMAGNVSINATSKNGIVFDGLYADCVKIDTQTDLLSFYNTRVGTRVEITNNDHSVLTSSHGKREGFYMESCSDEVPFHLFLKNNKIFFIDDYMLHYDSDFALRNPDVRGGFVGETLTSWLPGTALRGRAVSGSLLTGGGYQSRNAIIYTPGNLGIEDGESETVNITNNGDGIQLTNTTTR